MGGNQSSEGAVKEVRTESINGPIIFILLVNLKQQNVAPTVCPSCLE